MKKNTHVTWGLSIKPREEIKKHTHLAGLLSLGVLLIAGQPAFGVSLGLVDDFPADVLGWAEGGGSPTPPTWIAAGGPDGTSHLQNNSDGRGSGGKMVMWNDAQWTGDYLVAGVTRINLFADNRSGSGQVIDLRLAFNGPGGWFVTPAAPIVDTLFGVDEWQFLTFDLSAAGLTHVTGGSGSYAATMGGVTRMEMISENGVSFSTGLSSNVLQGDAIIAELHVDKIAAVPEPASAIIAILGVLSASLRVKRRRTCFRFGSGSC